MRLRKQTLERVEYLKKAMETDNRTQVVAQAIRIAYELARELGEGNKLFIETPEGKKKKEVKVVGL